MTKALLLSVVIACVACVPMSRRGGEAPPARRAPTAAASAETCTFSSDCGEGRSCRADASGTNVCMGGGYAGDPCWFSSDCVSGSCDSGAKLCK